MPAYQAAGYLPTTLPALLAAAKGAPVVVVDPGSTDDSAAIAESLGARVVRLGRRAGPAEARNAGVATVEAEVVLFVDSDCIAHPDIVDRVRRAFAENASLVSLTGSYDDSPPAPGFFSQYMNLRHHRTHQRANREGASFWAGCGAVRLSAFRRCGGYDAALYPRPMIEDIELGLRLHELGATHLDPDLQVTHMKRWTLRSTVTTDIVHRAIPWSRLILERGVPNDLNLRTSQRVAAVIAPLAIASVPAIGVALATRPAWVALPLAIILVSVLLNFDIVRFFARRRGIAFGCGAWLFHQVHLFYSATTFALVAVHRALTRRGSPSR
jgi:glycosyltransferase involved in cell wall biosynthesis